MDFSLAEFVGICTALTRRGGGIVGTEWSIYFMTF